MYIYIKLYVKDNKRVLICCSLDAIYLLIGFKRLKKSYKKILTFLLIFV